MGLPETGLRLDRLLLPMRPPFDPFIGSIVQVDASPAPPSTRRTVTLIPQLASCCLLRVLLVPHVSVNVKRVVPALSIVTARKGGLPDV